MPRPHRCRDPGCDECRVHLAEEAEAVRAAELDDWRSNDGFVFPPVSYADAEADAEAEAEARFAQLESEFEDRGENDPPLRPRGRRYPAEARSDRAWVVSMGAASSVGSVRVRVA